MKVSSIIQLGRYKTLNSYRQKHYFGPYVLGSQSIWSLHFGSNQFHPCYFQVTVNLVFTINSLTENAYVANGVHY